MGTQAVCLHDVANRVMIIFCRVMILFCFFLGILKHDACWNVLNQLGSSVSTCVDVPAGWSHRLRLSGYQLLPAETWSCRGDVTGAQRRSPSPLQPASEMGSPGITWSTLSWASCQAIAGRSFLWNAALQSLHLGPGGWWIIEIGKPWNTRIFN